MSSMIFINIFLLVHVVIGAHEKTDGKGYKSKVEHFGGPGWSGQTVTTQWGGSGGSSGNAVSTSVQGAWSSDGPYKDPGIPPKGSGIPPKGSGIPYQGSSQSSSQSSGQGFNNQGFPGQFPYEFPPMGPGFPSWFPQDFQQTLIPPPWAGIPPGWAQMPFQSFKPPGWPEGQSFPQGGPGFHQWMTPDGGQGWSNTWGNDNGGGVAGGFHSSSPNGNQNSAWSQSSSSWPPKKVPGKRTKRQAPSPFSTYDNENGYGYDYSIPGAVVHFAAFRGPAGRSSGNVDNNGGV